MQAVILAGGRGTRLRPITNSIPKPMIMFHGKPFLEYLIIQLKEQGIKKVLLLLGYLPDVIMNYFKDGRQYGIHIEYHISDVDNDTGKRLFIAKHKIDSYFFLLYCDNYIPVNLKKMWKQFHCLDVIGQLTIYNNKDLYSTDNVFVNNSHLIEIYDKTRTIKQLNGVDIGYAIFCKEVFHFLPDKNINFEAHVYSELVKKNKLAAFTTDHRYYSVSNHDRLHLTEQFLNDKKVIFLDRDGVLNRKRPKATYVTKWNEFIWIDGAKKALQMLSMSKFTIIIITNQAGIARGIMTVEDLDNIHNAMKNELALSGIQISAIYYCPHGWDDNCECRKPKPGMLYKAQKDFHLDLTKTILIGDDERDMLAGNEAGCLTYMVNDKQSLLKIVKTLILK